MGADKMGIGKRLTALGIKALGEGYHKDRGEGSVVGLYLQVKRSAKGVITKSWLYRFRSPQVAKQRWMGLGPCDVIGLAEARDLARAARRLVALGRDPIEHRRETVQAERNVEARERASRMTFRDCAERYAAAHFAKFKNDKHRRQWRASLNEASAAFADLPVGEIDTPAVVKFLEPIWQRTAITGMRTRGRIEAVLDWASVHRFRVGDNPARWKGHLEHVFAAKPECKPHEALPWQEVPAFLAELANVDQPNARAVEIIILTALRKGEAINGTWNEIDLDRRLWTIPAKRMKAGREHIVPLSDQVVALLAALPRNGKYVFAVETSNTRIGETGLLKLIKRHAPGCTLHGFRSSFRDWAGEVTSFDREVIEHALAHQLPDRTEAAYRRQTAIEKRRRLMQSWADHCTQAKSSVVIQMR